MSTSQIIELILPLLAGILSSIMSQDGLPEWANTLITLAFVVLAGVATAFLGGELTGHVQSDVGVIVVATLALQALPNVRPLFDRLQSSLLVLKKPLPPDPPAPIPVVIQPAARPQVVPQRASDVLHMTTRTPALAPTPNEDDEPLPDIAALARPSQPDRSL